MNVIVKARHMHLTPALREHAERKLGDAVLRIFDRPDAKLEIELIDLGHAKDRSTKECRVTVSVPRGKTLVISEVDDDMYKAIDLAHDRLLLRVKRELDRQQDTKRNRRCAADERARTARETLTTQQEAKEEPWQAEVRQYQNSTAGV